MYKLLAELLSKREIKFPDERDTPCTFAFAVVSLLDAFSNGILPYLTTFKLIVSLDLIV